MCGSPIEYSGKGKAVDTVKKISSCQGLRGGMNWWSRENFEGSKNTLCDTRTMTACHYTFVQTHRMGSTKSEPQCTLWTSVSVMCRCRFISANKCLPLAGMLITGEAVSIGGQGVQGTLCTFCSFLLRI